jgi:hypothetical protein
VNDQVEAVVGGSRPDRAGVDGVPGEAHLHVQFDAIEASVGGSGEGRPVVAAVFHHESLTDVRATRSAATDEPVPPGKSGRCGCRIGDTVTGHS